MDLNPTADERILYFANTIAKMGVAWNEEETGIFNGPLTATNVRTIAEKYLKQAIRHQRKLELSPAEKDTVPFRTNVAAILDLEEFIADLKRLEVEGH